MFKVPFSQVLGDIMLEIEAATAEWPMSAVLWSPFPVPKPVRQVRLELAGDRIQGVERVAAGASRPSRAVLALALPHFRQIRHMHP